MEKKSRSELIKIIETQSEQLTRYETRLRDVVSAYKNLLKEKEALNASIKVLTSPQQEQLPKIPTSKHNKKKQNSEQENTKSSNVQTPSPVTEANNEKNCKTQGLVLAEAYDHPLKEQAKPTQETETENEKEKNEELLQNDTPSELDEKDAKVDDDDDSEENKSDSNDEISFLKEKVTTLSSTLQTVMEQKEIMETNYQVDKKKMMQEFEAKHKDMQEENETLEKKLNEIEKQLKESKQRMRQEQKSREEEENNNMLMLRELQVLLSKERTAREELDQQLDEAREKLISTKSIPESKALEYEQCIKTLKEELEAIQNRLKNAEESATKPSPLLLRLQEEMDVMKKENVEALMREQKRANEAEERLKMLTIVEEDRVSDLENKLSELSEVVGHYEKLKFQDQLVIQKLKERLQQLDVENTALSQNSPTIEVQDNRCTDIELESLREHVDKLKAALKYALQNSGMTVEGDLEGLSKSELDSILNSDPTHKLCQQELKHLKDEFELYKSRTSVLHKNKSFKELTAQLENLEKLKTRNQNVEKRLLDVQEKNTEKENYLKQRISELENKLKTSVETLTEEKQNQELLYRHKLVELEKQVLKQRERTIELLAEKEAEINSLRTRSPSANPSGVGATTFSYPRRYIDPQLMQLSQESERETDDGSMEETNAAVCQLITRQTGVSSSEGVLIHFAQQQVRREAETASLRRKKIEMEDEMREMSIRLSKHDEQCETLKEEIRKLERDRSRESANLEYLKNIVLRFMLSTSYSVKEQMVLAIATILEFSPKEFQQVRKANVGGWWS